MTTGRVCKGFNSIQMISAPMNNASGRKNGANPVPNVTAGLWVSMSSATGADRVRATSVRCCGVHDGTWVDPSRSAVANCRLPVSSFSVPAASSFAPLDS